MKMQNKNKKPKRGLTRETFFEGLRIIGKYLRPHKKILIFLITLGLIDATAQAFVPLIVGKIFDAIIAIAKNHFISLMPIFTLIAIWFLLQLSSNTINWRTSFNNERIGTILESEYIAKGFGKLFEMPLSFHAIRKKGGIVDRILRAAGWMESIVSRVFLNLLPNFLSIFVALLITALINWKLMLVLAAAILIYSVILWKAVPSLAKIQRKMYRAYNLAYGNAYDALDNIREIKQAATEKSEQKKIYKAFVDRAAVFWLNLTSIFQKINFSQRILITLTQLSIFVLSIFFVKNGTLTPGQLVAFNGYAAMILRPFVVLGQNWQIIQNGLVAIVRAEKIIGLPGENYEPKNAIIPNKLKGEIAFNNIYFSYKNNEPILKGTSFNVRGGEKIAIVGESGVGKTTIIDLLLGFYFPQEGKILVDGIDIKRMNLTQYRSRIGVVPQELTLFNDTIENNIRYGNLDKSRKEMIEAAKEAHAHEFIESFPRKYKQIVGWRGIKLSIGQKQRIALARAFLRNPDILILDEPTSALDAQSENLIKISLRKLMAGRTTFIIAHRLSTVREVDTILVLKDGKIIEQGKHDELIKIKDGVYRKLHELQTGFSSS